MELGLRRFSTSAIKITRLYALHYGYPQDVLTRRDQLWSDTGISLRQNHFKYISGWVDQKKIIIGGAYDPPSDGALIILDVANKEEAEEFVNLFLLFFYYYIKIINEQKRPKMILMSCQVW